MHFSPNILILDEQLDHIASPPSREESLCQHHLLLFMKIPQRHKDDGL